MVIWSNLIAECSNRREYVAITANAQRRINRLEAHRAAGDVTDILTMKDATEDRDRCFAALTRNVGGRTEAAQRLLDNAVSALNA